MNVFGGLACYACFLAGSYWGQYDDSFVGALMIFTPIIAWGIAEILWIPFEGRV